MRLYVLYNILMLKCIMFCMYILFKCLFITGVVPEEKFPVMVWFHPGEFHWGAPVYWDASVLAARHKVCNEK